jgi:oligopeptide transport system substrate-binding protein
VERVANPNGNDRKARDEGRSPDYDAEERNTASTRVGRNPSGQGFAGSLPCQAPSEGNQPFASSPSSHPIPQSRCRDHEGLAQRLQGQPKRKPIEFAQKLLAEAGYPDGIDAKTGQPLVLYLDTTSTGVGEKARLDWIRKQFAKLNIQLVLRNTDYNRFQDKVNKGATQMFYYGWNADYPDPENFLFLLTSAQTKVGHDGENAANYSNPEYDRLFEQMKNMDNGPARQAIIDRMVEILRHDAPWMWGEHPKDFVLHHSWLYNSKPNKLATNNLKYLRVDAKLRDEMRKKWNQPRLWPLALLGIALAALGWSLRRALRQREESR